MLLLGLALAMSSLQVHPTSSASKQSVDDSQGLNVNPADLSQD